MSPECKYDTLSTPGCEDRGAPASGPNPVITLKTPRGRPTSLAMPASSKHVLQSSVLASHRFSSMY